jgi:hypothetical protein
MTDGMPIFEYRSIGSILKSYRLKVPLNQREYSWEDEQVTDLFQDFLNAMRQNSSSYFLGTIVLSKGTKIIPEVVDGQQRLATISILLATIRDYYFNKGDSFMGNAIDDGFLTIADIEAREKVPKLTLNVDDNEYFKNKIISLPNSPERKSVQESKASHKRITFAAQKAHDIVQNITRDFKDRDANEVLKDLTKFIENKAHVILITVPDEMNAFMMFETLNDRGLKTSQADLLKNYLFKEAGERLDEAQQKWSRMISVLETLGIEDLVMTYLRHLTITQFGPAREKEVFDKIQNSVSGRTGSIGFLEKLARYAESYAALLDSSHMKWNSYSEKTRNALGVLKELKVQQIRPLMLAVAQHFDTKEAEIAFRTFVSWTVRFLISGGMRGGQLEDAYGQSAHNIVNGKIKNTVELLNELSKVIPNDKVFETEFSTAHVSQQYLARYYLRSIEAQLRKEDDPELVPIRDTEIMNLEHILPEEIEDKWTHIDSETAAVYAKRLGNMTLLKRKKNEEVGNEPFSVKRKEFETSSLLLNKYICQNTTNQTKWGQTEINERQKKLAEWAVKTWPLIVK